MTDVYKRALVQRNLMFGWFLAFFPVFMLFEAAGADLDIGFLIYAAGFLIVGLRVFIFNCPHCGHNLFRRWGFSWPWPHKICSKCGADLAGEQQ